jgi:hypothetical protein
MCGCGKRAILRIVIIITIISHTILPTGEFSLAKVESEQLIDSKRTRTVPNYSNTNWLSQRANKAPNNTESHKAKKARKTQEINGLPDNGSSFDINTKVRNSLKSPSTDGRSLRCSSSDDTQCGGDKPQERAQLRNTAELMKKRRLEVEEYSFDSLLEVTTIAGGVCLLQDLNDLIFVFYEKSLELKKIDPNNITKTYIYDVVFWVSTPGNSKNIVPTKKLKE